MNKARHTNKTFAAKIRAFVYKYAMISPNWDNDETEDGDDKYTGPDPYELLRAAYQIEQGFKPEYPYSQWGSGCYHPYSDKKAQIEHEKLLIEIKDWEPINPNIKYCYWHYNSAEFGICKYKKSYTDDLGWKGPYDTFDAAKDALTKSIKDKIFDYKEALQLCKSIKKEDIK